MKFFNEFKKQAQYVKIPAINLISPIDIIGDIG